jgi:hypothetical protein
MNTKKTTSVRRDRFVRNFIARLNPLRIAISGLPPMHLVHLLAQRPKRLRRKHRLYRQLEVPADLERQLH